MSAPLLQAWPPARPASAWRRRTWEEEEEEQEEEEGCVVTWGARLMTGWRVQQGAEQSGKMVTPKKAGGRKISFADETAEEDGPIHVSP